MVCEQNPKISLADLVRKKKKKKKSSKKTLHLHSDSEDRKESAYREMHE